MRADRLVATVLLLQTRGRVTAAELAAELEVSLATARRDLESLSAAGVPVYPQAGRGGGWQLVGGARTDLTGLTAGEAEALFALLGPASRGVAGHRAETATAVRKLVRALPATFRADAEAAAGAVHVDPSRWGAQPPAAAALLSELGEHVVRRRVLDLAYRSRTGEEGRRTVEPLGLVDKDGTWYLVAGTGRGRRTFRVDRIGSVRATGATFERPAALDLAQEWGRTVAEVERRRSAVTATVRAPLAVLPVLRAHFGTYLEVLEEDAGGRTVVVRVGAHLVRALAEQLAGWGGVLDVLGPPEVRSELARIGHELVDRYAAEG